MKFTGITLKKHLSFCIYLILSSYAKAQTYKTVGIDISKGLYTIELENENLSFNDSIKSSSKLMSFHISTELQEHIGIMKRSLLSASPSTKNYAELFEELKNSNSRKISVLSKSNFLRYFNYVAHTNQTLKNTLEKRQYFHAKTGVPYSRPELINDEFETSWAKLSEIPLKYYSPEELTKEIEAYPFLKILISKNKPILPCGTFSFSWTDSMIDCQSSDSSKAQDGSFSKNGVVILRMYSFKPDLMEWVHDKENNIIWGPEQNNDFLRSLPETYKVYTQSTDSNGNVLKSFNPRRTARNYCSSLSLFGLNWELAYTAQYSSADLKNKLQYAWLPGFTDPFTADFSKKHQIPESLAWDNRATNILFRELNLTDIRRLNLKEYTNFGFRCTAKPDRASQEKLDALRTSPPVLP